jgi:hypothetical protein
MKRRMKMERDAGEREGVPEVGRGGGDTDLFFFDSLPRLVGIHRRRSVFITSTPPLPKQSWQSFAREAKQSRRGVNIPFYHLDFSLFPPPLKISLLLSTLLSFFIFSSSLFTSFFLSLYHFISIKMK